MTKTYSFAKSLNDVSGNIFKGFAKNQGILDSRFITNWKDIVGEDLYTKCKPYLTKKDFPTGGTTLFVVTSDASFKALFTHYKPVIINKINLYFGANCINDVKVKRYE